MTEAMKRRILGLALQIMEGNIQADPVALEGGRSACTFCDYQDVCGFDRKLPGCRYYQISEKIPKERSRKRTGSSNRIWDFILQKIRQRC